MMYMQCIFLYIFVYSCITSTAVCIYVEHVANFQKRTPFALGLLQCQKINCLMPNELHKIMKIFVSLPRIWV
jgi:hypothetical protein